MDYYSAPPRVSRVELAAYVCNAAHVNCCNARLCTVSYHSALIVKDQQYTSLSSSVYAEVNDHRWLWLSTLTASLRYFQLKETSPLLNKSVELNESVAPSCYCRYQGHIGSSLIVGGVDVNGPQLYSVYPHGSYDKLPFLTMGTAIIMISLSEHIDHLQL